MVFNQDEGYSLERALAHIGKNDEARHKMVALFRKIEPKLTKPDFDARKMIIAPLLDALYEDVDVLDKTVQVDKQSDILHFYYYYRSQNARAIVLSYPEISDHIWEPQTTKLLLHLSQDASTVVIGGAYSGDHALLVAQSLNSKERKKIGLVHCFEMDNTQLEMCRENAKRNNLSNLVFHNKALYSNDNVSLRLVGSDALASAEKVPPGTHQSVPGVTLEKVFAHDKVEQIDLIMLDIEGGELAALQGGEQFLSQPPCEAPDIIFEIHRHYVDWSDGLENTEIIRLLRGHGYQVFAIRDYQNNVHLPGYPIELIPPETCVLQGPEHGFNMVAVKDIGRLRSTNIRYIEHVSPKLLFHRSPELHSPGKPE